MAEIDTSIYGNLLKVPSPMEQAGAFANISNALAHNSLMSTQSAVLGQQFRANRAMGPIMQQSVGPDGNVDYDKAVTLMAQNPETAYLAPDFMYKAFQGKGLQLDNKLKQLDVMGKEQSFFGNAAGALLAKGSALKRSDVADAMSTLYADMSAAGLGSDGMKDRLIGFMGQLKPDGQPLYEQMRELAQRTSGAADSINKVVGAFQVVEMGGHKVLAYTSPINKQLIPIGSLDMTPTPAEMNAPQVVKTPEGGERIIPRIEAAPMYTGSGAPMNTGGAPAVGSITKLPTEQQGALDMRVARGAEYAKNLQTEVTAAQTQLMMNQQLQSLFKQFKAGAGNEVAGKIASFAQAVGMPQDTVDKIGAGNLGAMQAFQKYAVQNTMNVLRQAIGGQGRLTNLEFEQFLHSNPNIDTDPRAIEKILKFSEMLYKLKIREQRTFNKYVKAGPTGGGGLPADFQDEWMEGLAKQGLFKVK